MVKVDTELLRDSYEDFRVILPRLKPDGGVEDDSHYVSFRVPVPGINGGRFRNQRYKVPLLANQKARKKLKKNREVPLLTIRTDGHVNPKTRVVTTTKFNRDLDEYLNELKNSLSLHTSPETIKRRIRVFASLFIDYLEADRPFDSFLSHSNMRLCRKKMLVSIVKEELFPHKVDEECFQRNAQTKYATIC